LRLGELLEHEVCSNMSILAPEAPICMEAAQRLQVTPRINRRRVTKSPRF
jgi:hypothetical protein